MSVLHSDHGSTVIGPDDIALVFDKNGEVSILLSFFEDDREVPDHYIVLAAVAARYRDQEWVEEMIDWFKSQRRDG